MGVYASRGRVGGGKPRRLKLTPPDPSEDELQASIADFLDFILDPEKAVWSHFPAGGYFLSPAARGRLYRLGLKPGWPDIVIGYAKGRCLWLEVKTPTGMVSFAQRERHAQLRALGHVVVVVRRVEDVADALRTYQVPHRVARLVEGYHGNMGAKAGSATQPA